MIYILYVLFFAACVTLIGSVLLQPGKTDAGALFTSNVSSSAFSPRGTASVLSRITITAAAVFMLSALLISMPALSGNISVLQGNAEETPATAPADVPGEVPVVTNTNTADANASATTPASNTNGALIETPATKSIAEEANSANAAPANK